MDDDIVNIKYIREEMIKRINVGVDGGKKETVGVQFTSCLMIPHKESANGVQLFRVGP